jgi:hypothetical protein
LPNLIIDYTNYLFTLNKKIAIYCIPLLVVWSTIKEPKRKHCSSRTDYLAFVILGTSLLLFLFAFVVKQMMELID